MSKNIQDPTIKLASSDTELGFIEKQAKKIYIFGYKIDEHTMYVNIFGFIITIILWYAIGLNKINCLPIKILFYLLLPYWLFQIDGHKEQGVSHISTEETYLSAVRNLCVVVLGSTILISVFVSDFQHTKTDTQNYLLLAISNIALLLGVIWFNFPNKANYMRKYKNIVAALYSIGLTFLVVFIFKVLICEQLKKYKQ